MSQTHKGSYTVTLLRMKFSFNIQGDQMLPHPTKSSDNLRFPLGDKQGLAVRWHNANFLR
jgi:hypothetical protein